TGLSLLDEALHSIEALGMAVFLPVATVHRGEALALAGRFAEALDAANHALTVAKDRGQHGIQASALRLRADVMTRLDASGVAAAMADYREALAIATERSMRPLAAHCHLSLGTLARRAGDRQDARTHLAMAASMYRAMDMRPWQQQAEAELL